LAGLADHYVALACRLLGVSRATRRGGADISAERRWILFSAGLR